MTSGRHGRSRNRRYRDPVSIAPRTARIERATTESRVVVELDLDGTGAGQVSTGVRFFDHMLGTFARHSLLDLTVTADGDTDVDAHHTVEDVAIVLGQAIDTALGDKAGIRRFGDATVPLDECLATAAVDLAGRAYCVHSGEPSGQEHALIGGHFMGSLTRHVFESLAHNARIAIHVRLLAGRDPHHVVEVQVKAFARAFRAAVEPDPRVLGVPSEKGAL